MQFSIKEWRKVYDLVHELGARLRDSRPTYDERLNYYPPKIHLDKGEQDMLETRIKTLMQRNSKYLDQCGMKMRKPLWYYDRKNPETWASDPAFEYGHLVGDVA